MKIICILEGAALETVKTKKGFTLLNSDEHQALLKKMGQDPVNARPDICHQSLLALLDSPLNKSGHLQVYIHTNKNVLIEVNSNIRIPRTYKRFSGLMVQLLHKEKVRSSEGDVTLMKVLHTSVTSVIPADSRRFATSFTGKQVDPLQFAQVLSSYKEEDVHSDTIVLSFGCFSDGHALPDYAEEIISVSDYHLSTPVTISKLLNAFEHTWGIL